MNVYYNGNGPAWGKGKRGQKLTAFPLQKTFLWEDQEIYLPAIYARTSGVILDVCTKVPPEKMHHFLKKWPKKRRLSINGLEDFEKIEADNPCSIDFSADMRLDNKLLKNTVRSSLVWHPDEILRMEKEIMQTKWNNDSSALFHNSCLPRRLCNGNPSSDETDLRPDASRTLPDSPGF